MSVGSPTELTPAHPLAVTESDLKAQLSPPPAGSLLPLVFLKQVTAVCPPLMADTSGSAWPPIKISWDWDDACSAFTFLKAGAGLVQLLE